MSLSNLNTFNYSLSLDGLQTIEADSIILNGDEIDFSKYYTKDETYSKEELKYVIEVDDLNDELKNYYTKSDSDAKYPLKTDLTSYLLVNTFNIERQTLIDAIALKLDASIISNYSTTTQLNNAISDALLNYFTKTEINNFGFQNSGQVSTAITNALVNYYTQSQINNFNYQSGNQVSTSISNALVNYYTQSQINNFGFQNSSQVNTAINNAISHLSTVDGTNQTIIDALVNYPTNQSLQDTLANYVLSTHLTSNYSTTTTIANTYKTIASFNSDINNYYTKAQSDANYLPKNETIVLNNGLSLYIGDTLTTSIRFHHSGPHSYIDYHDNLYIRHNDGNNNVTIALTMTNNSLSTNLFFNGVSPTQFTYLNSISSNVQNQLNARALITDLNNYVLSSTLVNYSTTTQLNNILTSYATIAMLDSTNAGFGNYYNKNEIDNLPSIMMQEFDTFNFTIFHHRSDSVYPFLYYNTETAFKNQVEISQYISLGGFSFNSRKIFRISGYGAWDGTYNYINVNDINTNEKVIPALNTTYNMVLYQRNSISVEKSFVISQGVILQNNIDSKITINGTTSEITIGDSSKNIRFHKTNVAQNADFKNNKMFFRHVDSNDIASNILELTSSAVITHKELQTGNIRGEDIYGLTFNIFPHPTQQNAVLYVDSTGVITQSTITSTVLEYLSGTTSNIQTQITNNTNNFNNYYTKSYIDDNVVIKDVLNNVNINSLRINANTTDNEGYKTVLSMTCNSSGSNLVCYAERKNSEPIEKELTLNNVNIVTLDGESKLKIHVESLSSNSICSFLLKDSNNVLQPKLRLGFGATNNKLYGPTDYDDLKGDSIISNTLSANTITITNFHNISTPHFISQVFNRTVGSVNWGCGSEYRVSDVAYARLYGGNAGGDTGYLALNVRSGGGVFVGNYWEAQFYITDSIIKSNGEHHIKTLGVVGNTDAGLRINYLGDVNSGYSSFSFQQVSGQQEKLRLGYNQNNIFYGNTDINGNTNITGNTDITGNVNAGSLTSSSFITAAGDILSKAFITDGLQTNGGIEWRGDIVTAQWKCSIIGNFRLGFYRDAGNWSLQSYIEFDGGWIKHSDERLKENIESLNPESSLQKILNLNAKYYNLKDQPKNKNIIKSVGFIAQDVEKIIPGCVSSFRDEDKNDDKMKAVAYDDIFVHTTNSVKELYKLIKNQEDEINKLKNIIVEMNETLINIINYINK
jgi:hypothetical protein